MPDDNSPQIPSLDGTAGATPAAPVTPAAEPVAPVAPNRDLAGAFGAMDIAAFTRNSEGDFDDLPPDPSQTGEVEPVIEVQPGAAAPAAAPVAPAVEPVVPAAPKAPVVAPVTPAVQPAVASPPAAVVSPAQAPGAPAAVVEPQPASAQQYVDPFDHAEQLLRANESKFVEHLAENLYKVNDEDFQQVLNGDPKALGVLCARVHVNAVSSVMRTIAQQLPVHVHALLESDKQNREREDQFWTANPNLDRTKHKDLVVPMFRTFRQLNPAVNDPAVINKMVGALVAAASGVPAQAPAPVAAQVPAAPQVRTPGVVVRQVQAPGFAPAGTGGQNGATPARNQWDAFTAIMEADQAGLLDEVR